MYSTLAIERSFLRIYWFAFLYIWRLKKCLEIIQTSIKIILNVEKLLRNAINQWNYWIVYRAAKLCMWHLIFNVLFSLESYYKIVLNCLCWMKALGSFNLALNEFHGKKFTNFFLWLASLAILPPPRSAARGICLVCFSLWPLPIRSILQRTKK